MTSSLSDSTADGNQIWVVDQVDDQWVTVEVEDLESAGSEPGRESGGVESQGGESAGGEPVETSSRFRRIASRLFPRSVQEGDVFRVRLEGSTIVTLEHDEVERKRRIERSRAQVARIRERGKEVGNDPGGDITLG